MPAWGEPQAEVVKKEVSPGAKPEYEYAEREDREYPERYTGDYHTDSLPPDLWQLENAAMDGDIELVRKVVRGGADINAQLDNDQLTALMIACLAGNQEMVQVMVEELGADMDGPVSRAGLRAIDYAGREGFRFPDEHPIADYLKFKGSQHTWWGACQSGDVPRALEYLHHGQDIDEINPVLWNGNGVHLAYMSGNVRLMQLLIARGGTLQIRNCAWPATEEDLWSIGRGDAFYYKEEGLDPKKCKFGYKVLGTEPGSTGDPNRDPSTYFI